jgi:hypothetical protein
MKAYYVTGNDRVSILTQACLNLIFSQNTDLLSKLSKSLPLLVEKREIGGKRARDHTWT